ncbi:MAG: cysteine desulfurase family protein [Flavobacteriales bacterium]
MKPIYLDNAATTPMDPEVVGAMIPYMETHFGNPSSSHSFGRKTKTAIEQSRRKIASLLNCVPAEICFTSGGTEADNLAIRSAVLDLGCGRIITTAIEHSAVIKTADNMQTLGKAEVVHVNLDEKGHVDLKHLEQLMSECSKRCIVSLMHGNNEIANILPLKRVSEICQKYNAIFHSDTVQTMGHYAFDLQDLKIDFLTCAAHKLHGPKGIGFLYINKDLKIKPIIIGGGQERQLRGGTENLYGIIGLAKALEIANRELEGHQKYVSDLKQYMISKCKEELPGVEFNGDSQSQDSLYTVLNLTLAPCDNAGMMLFLLDLEGIACSGGSACSSGAAKGSHVLEAINAIKPGRASLRFSFSRFTQRAHIDTAVEKLKELCEVKELA